jgi:hypothetical protein
VPSDISFKKLLTSGEKSDVFQADVTHTSNIKMLTIARLHSIFGADNECNLIMFPPENIKVKFHSPSSSRAAGIQLFVVKRFF